MSVKKQIPSIDQSIGIGVYGTSFAGLGAGYAIRRVQDDFAVSEILSPDAMASLLPDVPEAGHHGDGCGGKATENDSALHHANGNATDKKARRPSMYGVYLLKKRGIDTAHALDAIYKMTGARLKPLGLKDASAVTKQYVCSTGTDRRLGDVSTPRFELKFAGYAKKPLTKKQMLGNKFCIRISAMSDYTDNGTNDTGDTGDCMHADPADFDGQDSVPNFYGYQRFGSGRAVTHLVGRAIVMRSFDEAVRLILEFDSEYDTPKRRELRQNLADPASYEQSAARLPAGMDTEKTVLLELARHGDSLRALKAVPLQLRRLYVGAYQSYVFNRVLSAAVSEGEDLLGAVRGDVCFDRGGNLSKFEHAGGGAAGSFTADQKRRGKKGADSMLRTRAASVAIPIIGYSYYSKTRFDPYVSYVLEDEPVRPRDFFIKEMQEVSGEGGFRDGLLQCSEYVWNAAEHTAEFSLVRGSFATMLLREIIKPPDPIAAGF